LKGCHVGCVYYNVMKNTFTIHTYHEAELSSRRAMILVKTVVYISSQNHPPHPEQAPIDGTAILEICWRPLNGKDVIHLC
jgi:hypothetical protein